MVFFFVNNLNFFCILFILKTKKKEKKMEHMKPILYVVIGVIIVKVLDRLFLNKAEYNITQILSGNKILNQINSVN
jgi:predicted membrane channel-forming protein YqfA (hemolysin III family)